MGSAMAIHNLCEGEMKIMSERKMLVTGGRGITELHFVEIIRNKKWGREKYEVK